MNDAKSLLDRRLEILGTWSGLVYMVFCGGGFVVARYIPPRSPSMDPRALATFVHDHKYQVLIGMLMVLVFGYTLLTTWSLTFAYQVRKYANDSPLAFYLMVIVGINGGVLGMLCGLIGSAMAYRVDSLDPATVQLMWDFVYWLFLLPWPLFVIWPLIAGFAILSKSNDERYFPRWAGYFSFWCGALEIFSALSVFYYSGPFSYNGAIAFWVPGVSFFLWVGVIAVVQIRSWSLVRDERDGTTSPTLLSDDEDLVVQVPDASKV
ncbi:hypothetical protein [Mycobacterium sp.]|uniref:hypothetical protein n=1 Tax=Mycobacterium sp. TaxID=1785 RepID=UPI003D0E5857